MNYPLVKRILIADDHPITRRGLQLMLKNEFQFCDINEVGNYSDLRAELRRNAYSHLILDLLLNDVNSADKISELIKEFKSLAILIYSMQPEEIYGPHMFKLGARGFLNKQASDEEIINGLNDFFTGKKYFRYQNVDTGKLHAKQPVNPLSLLSKRELEVLPYLLSGNSIKEISHLMGIKPNTVATYKARIFEKLQVSHLIELSRLVDKAKFTLIEK